LTERFMREAKVAAAVRHRTIGYAFFIPWEHLHLHQPRALSDSFHLIGYPYYWGGRSVKGFDCSGLIQTVFALVGIRLPRDAWMQYRDGTEVDCELKDTPAGDLYFFAEGNTKITHVGLAVGNGDIIHARGMVRINSLIAGQTNYSEELYKTFIGTKTFF